MAYSAKWTAYYVGHGAMNYIEIYNNNNNLAKVIIIDAGSTDDKLHTTNMNPNIQEVIDKLNRYQLHNVVIFITHTDLDHYSYITDIYNGLNDKTKIEKLYIGSQGTADSIDDYVSYADEKLSQLICALDDKADIMISTASPVNADFNDIGDMKFWLIANSIFTSGGTTNDNSAVFFLESASGNGFLFTGDITGKTMNYVLNNQECLESWKSVLGGKDIKMTIPHHGSLNSMVRDGFTYCSWIKGDYISRWNTLCQKLELNITGMILSYGYNDKFHHPEGTAINFYSNCMPYRKMTWGWQAWKSRPESQIKCKVDDYTKKEADAVLYAQNTNREVYPTVSLILNCFHGAMEHNWEFKI